MNIWQTDDGDDEQLINIPWMAHQRANKAAVERLGTTWTASNDRYVARWLFKRGHITDFQREQILDNIAEKVARTKAKFPNYGRFRLY